MLYLVAEPWNQTIPCKIINMQKGNIMEPEVNFEYEFVGPDGNWKYRGIIREIIAGNTLVVEVIAHSAPLSFVRDASAISEYCWRRTGVGPDGNPQMSEEPPYMLSLVGRACTYGTCLYAMGGITTPNSERPPCQHCFSRK